MPSLRLHIYSVTEDLVRQHGSRGSRATHETTQRCQHLGVHLRFEKIVHKELRTVSVQSGRLERIALLVAGELH